MKLIITLLLLVATASALPFKLDQLLPDLPQKSNTLDGGDNAGRINSASRQTSFGASYFSSQPVPAAIAPNEPQQPDSVRGGSTVTFGALLADQQTATQVPEVLKQEKNPKPFIESFAKQFSDNKQPAYGAALGTQSGGNQAPSFGVSPSGDGNQEQAAFDTSSNAPFGGDQPTGFGTPSEEQFRGSQEPAFGASSSSQFGGSQQSDSGVDSGNQFGGSQASFNLQGGDSHQGGFGASENAQAVGSQQSGSGAAPGTNFRDDQQAGSSSNFAGGSQNAATGSAGPYNVPIVDEYYIRTALPFPGYRPTKYTSLDLSQVDFQNALRSSGHEEYISVPGEDASDEAELYRLVGVAPASALQGGAATTYSANIGATVPVYRELEDDNEERLLTQLFWGVNPQASVYSAMAGSQQPVRVKVEATLAGSSFAVLLDD